MENMLIHNIVGSGCIEKSINLIKLAQKQRSFVSYNAELFPGAHIKFPDCRSIALVFTSGKIVVTGIKSEKALYSFYNKVVCLLEQCVYD